ncbi:ribosomal protection-like ABC-F family protein [Clostridium nigeriense]|uniref:ribosomal protection-like ABC-F family protein n=1 Tax=Clostridium nigeriense TaxID=1805470 RepID=UPI00082B1034|nr:ABC-F family ATP-binding cassette domain-containing protein [Clostridium nigeriense]
MVVLSCKDISKSYGIQEVLKKVTFSINEGDKVGIIGGNGEGKSTLFKIICKEIVQDDGEIFIDKNKSIGYLSQHVDLDLQNTIYTEMNLVFKELLDIENKLHTLEIKMSEPYDESNATYHEKIIKDYTTLQDLYSHKGGYTYKGEISRVLKGLGFLEEDFDKSIGTLSGGQKTRVSLCKLLLKNPDIILLDEPTNHLDLEAIEWLEEYLKNYKGTILVISHDRFFLDAVTNNTFEVINGHVNCYNVSYTKFIEQRKKNYEAQLKAYNLQQAEIKRQEAIIEKFRSFNREKSIRAAESREKVLDKMEKIDAPDKDKEASKIKFETSVKSGHDVLHIENLSKSYGENRLFSGLNIDLKRGEKVALIGENGRGKTTLFKIILNNIEADNGKVLLGTNVNVGYYDQEQSDLNLDKTIIDEVWDEFPILTTSKLRGALASFLFTGDDVFKVINTLSGGEKCRINLLKLMLSRSNLLLLDEPTNHLDIISREALEDALLTYDGTLMVISHDRYFLNKVINRILELKEDGVKEYLGNYSYYQEKKINPNRFEILEELASGKTKTQLKEEKKKRREQEKEEKAQKLKLKKIEEDIAKSEDNLLSLQEKLCLEEVYSNPSESERISKEIKILEEEIASLYEEWENLEILSQI